MSTETWNPWDPAMSSIKEYLRARPTRHLLEMLVRRSERVGALEPLLNKQWGYNRAMDERCLDEIIIMLEARIEEVR